MGRTLSDQQLLFISSHHTSWVYRPTFLGILLTLIGGLGDGVKREWAETPKGTIPWLWRAVCYGYEWIPMGNGMYGKGVVLDSRRDGKMSISGSRGPMSMVGGQKVRTMFWTRIVVTVLLVYSFYLSLQSLTFDVPVQSAMFPMYTYNNDNATGVANDADNWVEDAVPDSANAANFDGATSNDDCDFDLGGTLLAFNLFNGYSGTVTFSASPTFTSTSGWTGTTSGNTVFDANVTFSGSVSMAAAYSGQVTVNAATVTFSSSTTLSCLGGTIQVNASGTWGKSAGLMTVNGADIDLNGTGTLDVASTFTMNGTGTFSAETSSVITLGAFVGTADGPTFAPSQNTVITVSGDLNVPNVLWSDNTGVVTIDGTGIIDHPSTTVVRRVHRLTLSGSITTTLNSNMYAFRSVTFSATGTLSADGTVREIGTAEGAQTTPVNGNNTTINTNVHVVIISNSSSVTVTAGTYWRLTTRANGSGADTWSASGNITCNEDLEVWSAVSGNSIDFVFGAGEVLDVTGHVRIGIGATAAGAKITLTDGTTHSFGSAEIGNGGTGELDISGSSIEVACGACDIGTLGLLRMGGQITCSGNLRTLGPGAVINSNSVPGVIEMIGTANFDLSLGGSYQHDSSNQLDEVVFSGTAQSFIPTPSLTEIFGIIRCTGSDVTHTTYDAIVEGGFFNSSSGSWDIASSITLFIRDTGIPLFDNEAEITGSGILNFSITQTTSRVLTLGSAGTGNTGTITVATTTFSFSASSGVSTTFGDDFTTTGLVAFNESGASSPYTLITDGYNLTCGSMSIGSGETFLDTTAGTGGTTTLITLTTFTSTGDTITCGNAAWQIQGDFSVTQGIFNADTATITFGNGTAAIVCTFTATFNRGTSELIFATTTGTHTFVTPSSGGITVNDLTLNGDTDVSGGSGLQAINVRGTWDNNAVVDPGNDDIVIQDSTAFTNFDNSGGTINLSSGGGRLTFQTGSGSHTIDNFGTIEGSGVVLFTNFGSATYTLGSVLTLGGTVQLSVSAANTTLDNGGFAITTSGNISVSGGAIIDLTGSSATCSSITVSADSVFECTSGSVDVTGGSILCDSAPSGTAGTFNLNGNVALCATITLVAAASELGGLFNVGSGTVTATGDITVQFNATQTTYATFNFGTGSVSAGNFNNNGTISQTGSCSLTLSGNYAAGDNSIQTGVTSLLMTFDASTDSHTIDLSVNALSLQIGGLDILGSTTMTRCNPQLFNSYHCAVGKQFSFDENRAILVRDTAIDNWDNEGTFSKNANSLLWVCFGSTTRTLGNGSNLIGTILGTAAFRSAGSSVIIEIDDNFTHAGDGDIGLDRTSSGTLTVNVISGSNVTADAMTVGTGTIWNSGSGTHALESVQVRAAASDDGGTFGTETATITFSGDIDIQFVSGQNSFATFNIDAGSAVSCDNVILNGRMIDDAGSGGSITCAGDFTTGANTVIAISDVDLTFDSSQDLHVLDITSGNFNIGSLTIDGSTSIINGTGSDVICHNAFTTAITKTLTDGADSLIIREAAISNFDNNGTIAGTLLEFGVTTATTRTLGAGANDIGTITSAITFTSTVAGGNIDIDEDLDTTGNTVTFVATSTTAVLQIQMLAARTLDTDAVSIPAGVDMVINGTATWNATVITIDSDDFVAGPHAQPGSLVVDATGSVVTTGNVTLQANYVNANGNDGAVVTINGGLSVGGNLDIEYNANLTNQPIANINNDISCVDLIHDGDIDGGGANITINGDYTVGVNAQFIDLTNVIIFDASSDAHNWTSPGTAYTAMPEMQFNGSTTVNLTSTATYIWNTAVNAISIASGKTLSLNGSDYIFQFEEEAGQNLDNQGTVTAGGSQQIFREFTTFVPTTVSNYGIMNIDDFFIATATASGNKSVTIADDINNTSLFKVQSDHVSNTMEVILNSNDANVNDIDVTTNRGILTINSGGNMTLTGFGTFGTFNGSITTLVTFSGSGQPLLLNGGDTFTTGAIDWDSSDYEIFQTSGSDFLLTGTFVNNPWVNSTNITFNSFAAGEKVIFRPNTTTVVQEIEGNFPEVDFDATDTAGALCTATGAVTCQGGMIIDAGTNQFIVAFVGFNLSLLSGDMVINADGRFTATGATDPSVQTISIANDLVINDGGDIDITLTGSRITTLAVGATIDLTTGAGNGFLFDTSAATPSTSGSAITCNDLIYAGVPDIQILGNSTGPRLTWTSVGSLVVSGTTLNLVLNEIDFDSGATTTGGLYFTGDPGPGFDADNVNFTNTGTEGAIEVDFAWDTPATAFNDCTADNVKISNGSTEFLMTDCVVSAADVVTGGIIEVEGTTVGSPDSRTDVWGDTIVDTDLDTVLSNTITLRARANSDPSGTNFTFTGGQTVAALQAEVATIFSVNASVTVDIDSQSAEASSVATVAFAASDSILNWIPDSVATIIIIESHTVSNGQFNLRPTVDGATMTLDTGVDLTIDGCDVLIQPLNGSDRMNLTAGTADRSLRPEGSSLTMLGVDCVEVGIRFQDGAVTSIDDCTFLDNVGQTVTLELDTNDCDILVQNCVFTNVNTGLALFGAGRGFRFKQCNVNATGGGQFALIINNRVFSGQINNSRFESVTYGFGANNSNVAGSIRNCHFLGGVDDIRVRFSSTCHLTGCYFDTTNVTIDSVNEHLFSFNHENTNNVKVHLIGTPETIDENTTTVVRDDEFLWATETVDGDWDIDTAINGLKNTVDTARMVSELVPAEGSQAYRIEFAGTMDVVQFRQYDINQVATVANFSTDISGPDGLDTITTESETRFFEFRLVPSAADQTLTHLEARRGTGPTDLLIYNEDFKSNLLWDANWDYDQTLSNLNVGSGVSEKIIYGDLDYFQFEELTYIYPSLADGAHAEMMFAWFNTQNYYVARLKRVGVNANVELAKVVGGVETVIDTATTVGGGALDISAVVDLEFTIQWNRQALGVPGSIEVFVNFVQVVTADWATSGTDHVIDIEFLSGMLGIGLGPAATAGYSISSVMAVHYGLFLRDTDLCADGEIDVDPLVGLMDVKRGTANISRTAVTGPVIEEDWLWADQNFDENILSPVVISCAGGESAVIVTQDVVFGAAGHLTFNGSFMFHEDFTQMYGIFTDLATTEPPIEGEGMIFGNLKARFRPLTPGGGAPYMIDNFSEWIDQAFQPQKEINLIEDEAWGSTSNFITPKSHGPRRMTINFEALENLCLYYKLQDWMNREIRLEVIQPTGYGWNMIVEKLSQVRRQRGNIRYISYTARFVQVI